MKFHLIMMCGLLALPAARADVLSSSDREALLDRLAKLQAEADSRVDARFRTAITAYTAAMGSDDQAVELYLNCVEKVQFQDEQKKPADFREWRRKESERLSDPALRTALRHQLRWLVLTLQAASEDPDQGALASNARSIVSAIFDDAKNLASQNQVLRESVLGSVFAQAYEITNVKVEKWPLSPAQLEQVYEEVLLPPYRSTGNLTGLRTAWLKRMEQEGAIREFWSERDNEGRQRIGMAANMRPPAYEKFVADEVPELMWEMETDLFKHGDQAGAATRMLAHLEKHIGHRSASGWTTKFRELLAPAGPGTAKTQQPAGDTVR